MFLLLSQLKVYYNIRKKWCIILALIGLFVSSYIISWNTEAFSQIQIIKQSKSGNGLRRTKVKNFNEKEEKAPYIEDAIISRNAVGLKKPEPIKNIVFHKTHKTGGTTIQNILFQYAIKNELLVALPKVGHSFTEFKYQKIQNTEWYQAGLQPNIFCLHSIWNGLEIAKLFKNERPFYFSIIRDPLSLLISSWDYFGIDKALGMDLEAFASLVEKSKGEFNINSLSQKIRKNWIYNSILFDFGMNPEDYGNKKKLQNLISEIDQTFDLIMILEDFNESMVLLKNGLSWNYEDLLSVKLNVHNERTKTLISEMAKNTLRKWLKESYIFYDYFKVRHQERVSEFGHGKMKLEIEKFQDMNRELALKCQVKYIPQKELPINQRLYGQDIFGYEILGKHKYPQCKWIAMDEMKFMDHVRKLQNQKIAPRRSIGE